MASLAKSARGCEAKFADRRVWGAVRLGDSSGLNQKLLRSDRGLGTPRNDFYGHQIKHGGVKTSKINVFL